jgi:hypothetical protein
MSFTLQQSQFLSPLLGDTEISALFSAEADIAAMLEFEMALAATQGKIGFIPKDAADEISASLKSVIIDDAKLQAGVARDGMAVPELVAQLKMHSNQYVHFGATSQDAIDTSLMIRAQKTFAIFKARIDCLLTDLDRLAASFGDNSLMARTRMQQALPFTAANRITFRRQYTTAGSLCNLAVRSVCCKHLAIKRKRLKLKSLVCWASKPSPKTGTPTARQSLRLPMRAVLPRVSLVSWALIVV